MFDSENDILTIYDLIEWLHIGENYAYMLLNGQKIKGFRVGRTWRIPRKSVYDFVNQSLLQ